VVVEIGEDQVHVVAPCPLVNIREFQLWGALGCAQGLFALAA